MQAEIKQGNKSERRHLGIQNRGPKERDIYNLLLLAPLDSKYSVQENSRTTCMHFQFFLPPAYFTPVRMQFLPRTWTKTGSFWTTYPPDLVHVG